MIAAREEDPPPGPAPWARRDSRVAPGIEHRGRGRFEQAAECFEAVQVHHGRRDPWLAWHAAEARAALGLACFHAGDLWRARGQLERALALRPRFRGAAECLARIHHRCGQPLEALETLEQAAEPTGGIEAHLLRAVCLDQVGETAAARHALDQALASGLQRPLGGSGGGGRARAGGADHDHAPRATGYADLHCRLAARLADRDLERAAAHLEAALEINPRFLRARLALALVSLQLGRAPRSLALLERARELEPGYPDVLAWLGLARLRVGDGRGAARTLEQAAGMRREFSRARRFLALVRHAAGRTREALAEARRGLVRERDVSGPPGRVQVPGLEAEGAGQEDLLRALAIRPGCADLHLALGRCHGAGGALLEARQAFRAALALQPDYAAAMFELARLELACGRLAEAEALCAQLTRGRPGWVDAQALLGRARLLKGDARGAVLPLRAALRQRPRLAAARADLSWALLSLGRGAHRSGGFERVAWWEPRGIGKRETAVARSG